MSDVFSGDWSQLLIGQRMDFTVQTLVERYAELGQIGIIAHWRGESRSPGHAHSPSTVT
jgi:predicted phage gp36 major capsid-like protein